MNTNNRRSFIRNASIGTVAAISLPQIVSSALAAAPKGKKISIDKDDIILFQGDSITDSGRSRGGLRPGAPAGAVPQPPPKPNTTGMLGNGYALMAASQLLLQHADKNLQFYNRGVSGNKVFEMAARWDVDALDIKPNVISIHIGVNDYWHTLTNGYKGTIENYIEDYNKLIDRTKAALPNVKLIICEPFGVLGVKSVDASWSPTFDTFKKAARDIADKYDLPFVAYQAAFDKAVKVQPGAYWSVDGVHPTVAGAALMAQTWLEAVKA